MHFQLILASAIAPKNGSYCFSDIFLRCRDDAPVKDRMMISSSKDALKKAFDGVHYHLQANEESDLDYFEAARNVSKGDVEF